MNLIELHPAPNGKINSLEIKNLRQSLQTLPSITIEFDGQTLGNGLTHLDVIPDTYVRISRALKKQGGRYPSPQSIQELLDVSALVDKKTAGITQPYIFARMVKNMNEAFARSQDLAPTHKDILTAFYSCVDRVCKPSQEKIDQAKKDAISEGIEIGKTEKQVIQEIQAILDEPKDSKNIPTKAETKAQVVGLILRTFKYRINRASISDKKLADWIGNTFKKKYDKVGGASAQVADFLNGIGEKNCTVYTEYNSQDQANAYKRPVKFLHFSEKGLEIHQINDPKSIDPNHPIRINYPIEIPADTEVVFNGETIKSKNFADRIILTTEYFDQDGKAVNILPIFKCSDAELKQIASQYKYIILNGIQYLQKYPTELYQQTTSQIARQLDILKSLGVKTHYEISGDTKGKLQYLFDVVKGRITSMGIGHEELYDVVSAIQEMGMISPDIKIYEGTDGDSICENAKILAKCLNLDRLYVHGHSLDLTVRKGITQDEQLETEVEAMCQAKQRVFEWLTGQESTQITPEDRKIFPDLKREGFEEFAKLGRHITAGLNIDNKSKAKILKQFYTKGFYRQPEEEYSVAAIPVKWINNKNQIKGATSVGDIGSYDDFIHSGI